MLQRVFYVLLALTMSVIVLHRSMRVWTVLWDTFAWLVATLHSEVALVFQVAFGYQDVVLEFNLMVSLLQIRHPCPFQSIRAI